MKMILIILQIHVAIVVPFCKKDFFSLSKKKFYNTIGRKPRSSSLFKISSIFTISPIIVTNSSSLFISKDFIP